jgi:hypothetical protein
MIRHHIARARRGWHRWVDSDHSLAALLFFLVFYGFIMYPLAGEQGKTETFAAIAFSVVLVLGVMATTKHRGARMGMVALAGLAIASHWLHFFLKQHEIHVVATVAAVVFLSVLGWLITGRVFRGGSISVYRIYGAIAVYLILGILWGKFYTLICLFEPDAFYLEPATEFGEPRISELIYFSFTTLTTVGFGDIIPVHPIARSLATLEALVGQLYPAVLLARLVTLYQK